MENIEKKDSFVFPLNKGIKIQGNIDGKNKFIECESLYLVGPSLKHLKHQVTLKKLFMEGLFSAGKSHTQEDLNKKMKNGTEESSEETNSFDAKSIIIILYSAKDFDIVKFFEEFRDFLTSGVCYTDKDCSKRIKPSEISKLDINSLESLIGKYAEVFFISSWMETLS